MKLEFQGDLVSIYLPVKERDDAITFLDKYDISYREVEITRIDGNYIQFSFYASETIGRLFSQFKEEIEICDYGETF